MFQHTAARRRLVSLAPRSVISMPVSTHSRPKAAGIKRNRLQLRYSRFNTQPPEGGWKKPPNFPTSAHCFNTQPPEGGWKFFSLTLSLLLRFNTQPPEGGWSVFFARAVISAIVSTHSRPKAAGLAAVGIRRALFLFQHTAARRRLAKHLPSISLLMAVSTHSRPKAAGTFTSKDDAATEFQHTAARRRLD